MAEVAGMPAQDYGPQKAVDTHRSDGHSFEDVEVLPLQNRALLHYLQERGIPSAVAIANCKEMRYSTHGKRYFAVAFGNEGGGYEIRNPFFKGCVPPKDVTLLPVGSASCNVYEGFMDYLSARALGIGGKEDHLVLMESLRTRYGERVSNCSGIYDGCKDLNEHLQRVLAERLAQSENEKKNKSIRL